MFRSHRPHAPTRPAGAKPLRTRLCAAVFILSPLVAGCTALGLDESLWHNDDDGFYLDAQSCRTSAAFKTKVRMNAGGMSELGLDAGYDEKAYRSCMTEHGWEAKVVDETRSAVDECRNHALRLGVATPAESDPRLIRYLDTETFDECLLEHGVEGIVRVKPLRPAQPTSGGDR